MSKIIRVDEEVYQKLTGKKMNPNNTLRQMLGLPLKRSSTGRIK